MRFSVYRVVQPDHQKRLLVDLQISWKWINGMGLLWGIPSMMLYGRFFLFIIDVNIVYVCQCLCLWTFRNITNWQELYERLSLQSSITSFFHRFSMKSTILGLRNIGWPMDACWFQPWLLLLLLSRLFMTIWSLFLNRKQWVSELVAFCEAAKLYFWFIGGARSFRINSTVTITLIQSQ